MSRYRAPTPPSSPYVTRAGFARLQQELRALWTRRADVVTALSAAAAEGDRSENAEYHYRKKELGGIDRRIRYLQRRLPALEIVDARAGGERVFFGAEAWLEGESADGTPERRRVRLVGADEIDPARGHVSIDAPLARALLGRGVGDTVEIVVEGRSIACTVLAVRWPETEEDADPPPTRS